MLRRHALTVALVAGIFLLLWLLLRPATAPVDPGPPPAPAPPSAIAHRPSAIPPPPPPPPPALERSTLADTLNSPATDIAADLRVVADILVNFRTNFPRDGNPVGSNAEITAALTGQNRLRLALIPPDHPAINRDGELCDRWGTPFFFHAESATRMSIQSAGPDRKMHTADDVIHSPSTSP